MHEQASVTLIHEKTTMKKYLLFIPMMIGMSALAQKSLEFRIGPNNNTLRGGDFVKQYHNHLKAFSGGFMLHAPIKNNLSLLTGINYERNGSTVKDLQFTDNFGNYRGKGDILYRINYLLI